ncbi:X-ray repair cross-complementing protein 5 [Trichoplax sp. H2]|nr:X-ray repair cross-complementing protein 5 [Trichoplax sp. H2]|eukprot:RDD40807.1 X-ray repair cross-complementing protein 5 [Trichoplax sp. H2]
MTTFSEGSAWMWGGSDMFTAEEEDGQDVAADQEIRWANKDSLIMLIDCSMPMFRLSGGNDLTPFQLSIKCTRSVLMNKIVSSDKDLVGIVFFGTDKSGNPSDFKHIHVLQELDSPDAQRILELDTMLADEDGTDFVENYGHNDDFSMNDALWTCSHMFSNSQQKIGHKRIMLFTNNDDPHEGNLSLKRLAQTKAKDLNDIGIEIELMHIQSANNIFDITKFYQDIITIPEDEDVGAVPDASGKFDELLIRVRAKDHKKRSLMKIPLNLGQDLEVGVTIFSLCRPTSRPSYVQLDSKTNQVVKTVTKHICEDTGSELMTADIKYYQTFGGERVIFEKEEVGEIKNFGKNGLTLMGFKPKNCVKRHYHVRPSYFIYPDESVISGSTRLVSALLERTLARDVVAICKFVPRFASGPKFVALVPQKEVLDEHKVQVVPPGFNVVFLPYAEDFRQLKYEETPAPMNEQVDKAKDIVKSLTFQYNPDKFENPALQKHYSNLEALALDRDVPEEFIDYTEPDAENIDKRAGHHINDFIELTFPEGYDASAGLKGATKRKTTSATGGTAKKVKQETSEIDVKEYAQKGLLSKLTVNDLKAFCKTADIKCQGKKADLVAAVAAHFNVN